MYNHLADLCDNWNTVVDICNDRDNLHTPENAQERQLKLLDVLSWFTSWKMMHDNAVEEEESSTTKFNMFVKETWFCICALILTHVFVIQIHCIEKKERVNPRAMILKLLSGVLPTAGNLWRVAQTNYQH